MTLNFRYLNPFFFISGVRIAIVKNLTIFLYIKLDFSINFRLYVIQSDSKFRLRLKTGNFFASKMHTFTVKNLNLFAGKMAELITGINLRSLYLEIGSTWASLEIYKDRFFSGQWRFG